MTVLDIFKLDSNEKPVTTLQTGVHIFGRGDLLKCDDLRVSRNHGVIQVTEKAATITSTHLNPCFYQSGNSSTIVVLPRDKPINICDGDKFALLADQFWFRIKLTNNDVYSDSSSAVVPGPSIITKENNINSHDASSSADLHQRIDKRPLVHEDKEVPCEIKKFKYEDNDEESKQLLSVLGSLSKRQDMSDSEGASVDKDTELKNNGDLLQPNENDIQTEALENNIKSEIVSNSEDDMHETIKGNKSKKKSKNDNNNTVTSDANHDATLRAMLFSSDEEDNDSKLKENNVKKEDIEINDSNDNSKTNDDSKHTKMDTSTNEGAASNGDETDSNAAGTSNSDGKKKVRVHCWYGLSCYRKNPAHMAEFSHPGDDDYETDPEDDRPSCIYGATCYRQNKEHRHAYKHTNKPQQPPGNKRTKKKDKDTNTAPLKKRTTRKKYNEDSSEDEYDLKDPFIGDSGTEYEVTTSEDDDSDSDWSGGSEGDSKRLLKEAKRFTKGGK